MSQQPPPSGSMKISATVPFEQLRELLASPGLTPSVQKAQDLINIQPPEKVCTVCLNFDPFLAFKKSSADQHKLWADKEYKISSANPFGKITVEKSNYLLDAAKGGCIYCTMVQSALGAVSPGWETEGSYIHIFLALGLPVVVRLEFGVISSLPIEREAAGGLFQIELPQGFDLDFVITVGSGSNDSNASKPAIDVEIYRPRLAPDQSTVGDAVLAGLVPFVGFAEEIPGHVGDKRCLTFIQSQLSHCLNNHSCWARKGLPLLPDRVIWIEANNPSRIQLIEPKGVRAIYLALSYCWGPVSSDTYLTDASTYETRKAGIQLDDLPLLFQDIIACARALGIQYIWVDRLCIIQGSDADFKTQAPKMGDIYGNATVTIAAASASSEQDRIMVERDKKWSSVGVSLTVNGIGALKLQCRRRSHPLEKEDTGGDYGKVSTRAWIWQERLLAERTIFFTPSALKFECRCHSIWEGFDQGVSGHSWSAQLDSISHSSWTLLVEEFTKRDITRPSDRLPAMESVMKRIETKTNWTPLCGLWKNTLIEGLAWEPQPSGHWGRHDCHMNPGHYAPTWSWASVDGPISYIHARPLDIISQIDPISYDLECRKVNAASGLITVAGYLVPVELYVTVKREEHVEGNSVEQEEYTYDYKVKISNSEGLKDSTLKPDVALKPWSGEIGGQLVSTVVRVPYGESPPKTSWAGTCHCLLIGKTKRRCLVLYLGRSLRELGSWERIGMVDGMSPTVFSMSQREIINIV
ncbi:hypothetical protein V501_02154 [Pseudogymnoascus sp. VKM F-4519 (FW-2642)]|nr:hypothetical protein V501_02154 [Pseudogymnoascus sp. VKM F-4519 (FW-2642)]